MHCNSDYNYLAVFLVISSFFLGTSTNAVSDYQSVLENECAPHCLKLILLNSGNLHSKLEECDKKNFQVAALQSQLAVFQVREINYENQIKENEAHCRNQKELFADVATIKRKMEQMATQTRKEAIQLDELLNQIEDYRATIELKNEQIRSLKTNLQIQEYLLEACQANNTSKSAALMLQREKESKVYESSCLTMGNSSDILEIKVPGAEPFLVPCEGTIAGPGWTVIQRRVDKTIDFNRRWDDYRAGFGDLKGNLFIGLEYLYRMTNSQPHELFIYLENFENETRHAQYSNFSIGSENEDYKLKVLGEFSGNAGDALQGNMGRKFTTFDRDNDKLSFGNCAMQRKGGWWYNQCSRANLNGQYSERELDKWQGIWWWNWQETRTLKSVQMLIRPINATIIQK